MPSTVVVGGFFGDEGKGKIISYLAKKDNPTIVVRGGAGPNAGHTIKDGNTTYKVRMLPSGFLNKNARVMIGPGVVVDPQVFLKEIQEFGVSSRAFMDNHCGIIEQNHIDQDSKGRLKDKIGSTGSGTGPANAERAMRTLKMAKDVESLSSYIKDVPDEINSALKNNANKNTYLPMQGLEELRSAIANQLNQSNNNDFVAEDIIVGPGTKELMFLTQIAFAGEILLPAPSWVSYQPQAVIAKNKVHWIQTSSISNWFPTAEQLENKIKSIKNQNLILFMNSPNNPQVQFVKIYKKLQKLQKNIN